MRPDPCFERFRSLLPPCNYQVAGTWHHDQNKIKWRSDFEIGLLFVGDVLLSTRRNHPASNQAPSSACHPGAFACTIRKHSWLFLKIYWGFAKVVSAYCSFKWNHAGRKELTFVIKTFGGPRLPVLRLENKFRAIWYLVYNCKDWRDITPFQELHCLKQKRMACCQEGTRSRGACMGWRSWNSVWNSPCLRQP